MGVKVTLKRIFSDEVVSIVKIYEGADDAMFGSDIVTVRDTKSGYNAIAIFARDSVESIEFI